MVVIDEHDIGKTKIQILMDLLYESTGLRTPEDKIQYGHPKALDARPEVLDDPNTFIPVRIDQNYDDRLSRQSGFLYRRRDIGTHFKDRPIQLSFPRFPITLHEIILEQMNPQLSYPLDVTDFIDYKITDPETDTLKIVAHPESFIWCNQGVMAIEPPSEEFFVLVANPWLDGFKLYSEMV